MTATLDLIEAAMFIFFDVDEKFISFGKVVFDVQFYSLDQSMKGAYSSERTRIGHVDDRKSKL